MACPAASPRPTLTRLPCWGTGKMPERLDFGALWPAPPGRFGWTARGNAPCVMEIVSWLTTGEIDIAWPGVSPAIAEYIQAAQDALDDEARQKLLVLVPGLIGCASEDDPPEIEILEVRFIGSAIGLDIGAPGPPSWRLVRAGRSGSRIGRHV